MALVNQAKREINAKVVFFGPGLSGKATNLKHVHGKLKPEFRGSMKAMSVQDARMLFFDFTPPGDGNVQGFRVRFHVYTVSGQVVEPAAWKMVLKGVDGVVFVADATAERSTANQESLAELAAFLKGYGQSLSSVPVVFQYNKSDLPGATSPEELDRVLNPTRLPSFKASSQTGEGVLQTLLSLVKTVLNELRSKGLDGETAAEGLQGIVEAPVSAETAPSRTSQALQAEQAPQAAPAAPAGQTPPAAQAAQEEELLSLELSGAPQSAGPGLFRLPLTIRSGARSKSVLLNISLSLDEE
jgi:signal recognition particle receptor subunit beta